MARIIPLSCLSTSELLEKAEFYEDAEIFWDSEHHQAIRDRLTAEARHLDLAELRLKFIEFFYAGVMNSMYDVRKELARRGITTIMED